MIFVFYTFFLVYISKLIYWPYAHMPKLFQLLLNLL